MADKWLRSDEVLSLIELRRPDWAGNDESRLHPFLSGGMVRARAIQASFKRYRTQATESNWEIPPSAWAALKLDWGPGFLEIDRFSVNRCRHDREELLDIECLGLSFSEDDLMKIGGLGVPAISERSESSGPIVSPASARTAIAAGPGAKADALRWEQFAAAFAVLADNGQLDLRSENKSHESVANFLAVRGHSALSVDTVRPLIRRYKAWKEGHKFPDDKSEDDN